MLTTSLWKGLLLLLAVGPEREPLLHVPLDNRHADEVDEAVVGHPLKVQEDLHGAVRQFRRAEDVDALVADRQGLEGMVAVVRRPHRTLALAAGPECVGQLCQRENALAGVPLDLLLAQPPQQAQVVLLDRLLLAPLAKLADGAVIVEDQPGR
jgi:hypothetical protein